MESVLNKISAKHKKKAVVDVRSGDVVRVHQKIVEGGKERIQIFEGLVIRTDRKESLTSSFTVRRIASGVGVEKTYLIHSPNIIKIEVTKRSKVRRNNLSYMRRLTGKSARLTGVDFDRKSVNEIQDEEAEAEAAKIHEQQVESYDPAAAKAEKDAEKAEAEAVTSEEPKTESQKLEEKPKLKADAENPAEEPNKENK
jgi:large subunit ribosomal protein L19